MRCVVGQPLRCRPVVASPGTLSVPCYNIHCHKYSGQSQAPSTTFFALSVQIPASRPSHNDWSAPAPSFRPATAAPGRWSAPSGAHAGLEPLPPARKPPTAVLGPLMRAARCRCSPPLTCARQPTGAPAARRRRVGERPRMTRCRCRGACGRSPPARLRTGGRSAPRRCPRTGPSAAWGGNLAPPGSRSDPASRPRGPTSARMPPCARPAPLRSAADPLLNGAPVPVGRGSAPLERPSRPDQHASTARQPRSAPPVGRPALHGVLPGVLPVRLHGRAAPIRALQVPAQGCVDVHERLGAARQPLSSPPSASISASMCLRRRVSAGRRAAVAISAGPPIRPGTPGRCPPPPRSVPGPRSARGLPLLRPCV